MEGGFSTCTVVRREGSTPFFAQYTVSDPVSFQGRSRVSQSNPRWTHFSSEFKELLIGASHPDDDDEADGMHIAVAAAEETP